MKRLKLLPSVLMLVLCVGVLCMGIYAASPNSNQITGSITINAANPEVNFNAYLGTVSSETKIGTANGRVGTEIELNSTDLKFITENADTVQDVAPITIYIEMINTSTTEALGAYFAEGALTRTATYSDILPETVVYEDPDADVKVPIAKATFSFYEYLPKAVVGQDGELTCTPAYMSIILEPVELYDNGPKTGGFSFNLNIETYTASSSTSEELYKFSDSLTAIEWANLGTSVKGVVIPNTITSIGTSNFRGQPSGDSLIPIDLENITIPNSLQIVEAYNFGVIEDDDQVPYLNFNEWNGGLYLGNALNPYHLLVRIKNPASAENVVINPSCVAIQFGACLGLTTAKSVYIPQSVQYFRSYFSTAYYEWAGFAKTSGQSETNSNMKIYCGSASAPQGFGTYWNSYGLKQGVSSPYEAAQEDYLLLSVTYGTTYEQYLTATNQNA